MHDENDLTAEERMAFQRLPREAEASTLLEERVVRSLRREGILRNPGSAGRWLRSWMIAGTAAASLVLFGAGLTVGHWMGSRSMTQAFLAVREQDAQQVALRIQEAGSAYVAALASLTDLRSAEGSGGVTLGREAAMGALYGAAFELARLAPDDPDVLQVLQILEDRRSQDQGLSTPSSRSVVWF
jgi:hypothetical protein